MTFTRALMHKECQFELTFSNGDKVVVCGFHAVLEFLEKHNILPTLDFLHSDHRAIAWRCRYNKGVLNWGIEVKVVYCYDKDLFVTIAPKRVYKEHKNNRIIKEETFSVIYTTRSPTQAFQPFFAYVSSIEPSVCHGPGAVFDLGKCIVRVV